MKIFTVICESAYTYPFQRSFDVEDTDEQSAREFASHCMCSGKERIVDVLELKEVSQ